MAVNVQYDKVEWIEIGYNNANKVSIDNVVSFADRVISPDGDMVYPMTVINALSPAGIHDNHTYWEMELVLDTDYINDTGTLTNYWAYYQDVQLVGGVQPAIVCNGNNNYIEWFKVYIRESDGSQTELVYADGTALSKKLWCVGEKSEFNNAPGARHQTTTFKFICFGERGKTHSVAGTYTRVAAGEANVKYMRVDNVTITNAAVNIIRFSDDFIMTMTPQFVPNTFQGVDLKQDQHYRVLTFVIDSETSIFDAYFGTTIANAVIVPDTVVTFTLADGAGTARTWTYNSDISYVLSRRPGTTNSDISRDTTEYQILVNCSTKVIG